ncbi:hypothetical protein DRO19_00775 [Candidatus Bathyarchaeota archaeon]|nr:MAG: hypothetical protein DRO19_00775 [Candidatus Bathyarchaeota archaeon]
MLEIRGNKVFLDGKLIGWTVKTMEGKKAYVTPRSRTHHFFRNYQGWGIAQKLLGLLILNGYDEIHIRIGERETLISDVRDWQKHGIFYEHSAFEPQIILPEKYMRKHTLALSDLSR